MRFPFVLVLVAASTLLPEGLTAQQTITGKAAFADWSHQQPGVRRKITLADLPEPNPSEDVNNTPEVIARPAEVWPIAPAGKDGSIFVTDDGSRSVWHVSYIGKQVHTSFDREHMVWRHVLPLHEASPR